MNCQKGCCHEGDQMPQSCCGCRREILVSEPEADFLMRLAQIPFLPVVRFLLKSSLSSHLESEALAPVYLERSDDSLDTVKETGKVLKALKQKGLLSLDYDRPLEGGDYSLYERSKLFAYFKETVAEGSRRPGHLFNLPLLECGSIALTALGQQAVEQLEIIWER